MGKLKVLLGAGIGFLIGSGVGSSTEGHSGVSSWGWGFLGGVLVGVPAILIGAIIGGSIR